ncbi:MAG TPA: hypothetical protein ENH10_02595 [Bacteroidetes bacterium]|nr:hypothetical protein [Bacteroidota bacterium]HEX04029.1 hypothetical protein [Bacteroidota bacterium]
MPYDARLEVEIRACEFLPSYRYGFSGSVILNGILDANQQEQVPDPGSYAPAVLILGPDEPIFEN